MEFDRWAIPYVEQLIDQARQSVLKNHGELTNKNLNLRFMWSEDWEDFEGGTDADMQANTYVQDFNGANENTFRINKVDKQFAVILIGVLLGNLGDQLNSIRITIGQQVVREYPGELISSQLNGILLFTDGIYTLEKKKVEFTFHTTAAAPAACTAYPYGVVIIPAGA